jgi:hypothetical protein
VTSWFKVLSSFNVFVSWDRTRLRKGTTAETQTLCASPANAQDFESAKQIHPPPLLTCFAAFQISSPLRGDGDAVGNFFTTPRFTAPGQGRRRTRHVGRFFAPEKFLGLFA